MKQHICDFPDCRCHCNRPTLNEFCQSGRCQCPKDCPSCKQEIVLTIWDFKQFSKDGYWSFEKDDVLIWIQQSEKEMTVCVCRVKDGRPCQEIKGRVVNHINEAVAVANKMYNYYLNKK